MKNLYKYLVAIVLIALVGFQSGDVLAGNKDRSGQAGAGQLMINPWAQSSGWGSVGVAHIQGLESMFTNVAGLAFTKQTELIFANTQWLKGSDVNISAFGIAQRISETGVFGLSVQSMGFGEIPITTEALPEGGIGTFSPNLMTIGIAYSKAFSNSIYAGFNLKIVSETISDLSAQGVAIDAGIQYVTGEMENIRFGITLKNVGPTMSFSGDGISIRIFIPGQPNQFTMDQRSEAFELPTSLNIGASYDILFGTNHSLTLAGNFTSNSFTKDQFTGGILYNLKSYLMVRAGYTYEEGLTYGVEDPANRTNASKGFSGGFTVQVPMNKEKGSVFAVDYSYRATDNFQGTHSIGARITL